MSLSPHDPMSALLTVERNPFGRQLDDGYLDELDATGFWQADPALVFVAHTAHLNEVSRWGLLNALIAHRLSHIPPNVVLVGRQGVPGTSVGEGSSLNFYVGMVGRSGAGKSETLKLASNIIRPRKPPVPSGTGQGFVRYLAETVKETKDANGNALDKPRHLTRMLSHAIVVHAPEITQLTAEMTRLGSQTSSMMRNIYVGETLGTLTGDMERRVALGPNSFRAVMLFGSQFDTAGRLLGEYREGTPQRFAWGPALEYRDIPAPRPSQPAYRLPRPTVCDAASSGTQFGPNVAHSTDADPFEWDLLPDVTGSAQPPVVWVQWSPQMRRDIPAMKAAMRAADSNPFNPDRDKASDAARLDLEVRSHGLLGRIKTAAGIAFVCGRDTISDMDWQLSEVHEKMSMAMVAGMWGMCREVAFSQARSEGVTDAVRLAARNVYTAGEAQEVRARLADAVRGLVERYVSRHGPVFTAREVQGIQHGKARYKSDEVKDGIRMLVADGVVRHHGGARYLWAGDVS